MKRIMSIALLLAGAALLAGCPKKHNVIEPPSAGTQVPGSSNTGEGHRPRSKPVEAAMPTAAMRGPAPNAPVRWRARSFISILTSRRSNPSSPMSCGSRANLTGHPGLKLKLEGNTDERGTREYNIGLGERRAQAVRRALMLQGVAESQLTTVSFGAERPAVEGDDEAAWAQNRRVELVYATVRSRAFRSAGRSGSPRSRRRGARPRRRIKIRCRSS